MQTNRFQKGMATSTWMIVIALVGFFLTLLFKMGPVYLDNMGVRSALKSMANSNTDLHEMDKDQIYRQIGNYFTINGIRNINPKDLKIVRNSERTLINHEYEQRIHLFLNIDVVMTFRNQMDSDNIEACCEYLVEDAKKSKEKN